MRHPRLHISSAILCLLLLLSLSCSRGGDGELTQYETKLLECVGRDLPVPLSEYDCVVILPSMGCTGCITEAEDYFRKNVGNDRTYFVLTAVISRKNLGIKLGRENITRHNVFLDEYDTFYFEEYDENIYPYMVIIENGVPSAVRKMARQ